MKLTMKDGTEDTLANPGSSPPRILESVEESLQAKRVGDFAYVSGRGEDRDRETVYVGHVGKEASIEDAQKAAQLCELSSTYISTEQQEKTIAEEHENASL